MATIKAGTYRFNDVLTTVEFVEEIEYQYCGLTIDDTTFDTAYETFDCSGIYCGGSVDCKRVIFLSDVDCWSMIYDDVNGWGSAYVDSYLEIPEGNLAPNIIVPKDSEVSDEFYAWFTANAVEVVEEEIPVASIQYNGSTIASLEAGRTATLKCKGMQMVGDVVVEVGDGGGSEPVLQEKTVTENGEYLPDRGYDGFSKFTVDVQGSGGGGGITTASKARKSEMRYVVSQLGTITTTATVSVA